jgi:hypothetical protein
VGNTSGEAAEERIRDSRLAVDAFFLELSRRIGLETTRIQFLVDGMRPDLYSPEKLARVKGSYFDLMRQYFIETATLKGYEVIDLQPQFIARHHQNGARFEFSTDAHWNGLGHNVAADAVSSSNLANTVLTQSADGWRVMSQTPLPQCYMDPCQAQQGSASPVDHLDAASSLVTSTR